jgi:hypothetical protein
VQYLKGFTMSFYADSPSMFSVAEVRSREGRAPYSQDMAFEPLTSVRGPETNRPYVAGFAQGSFGDATQLSAMSIMDAWKRIAATERWRRFVVDRASSTDVDALTETVEAVLDFIAEFGPGALSLGGMNRDRVQCEHLAALLRATSSWRANIPGWYDALNLARAASADAGLDAEDILFGMI